MRARARVFNTDTLHFNLLGDCFVLGECFQNSEVLEAGHLTTLRVGHHNTSFNSHVKNFEVYIDAALFLVLIEDCRLLHQ